MQPSGLRSCNERDDTTLNRSDLRIVIGCCRNRKEPSHIAIRTVKIGGKSTAIGNADIKDNTGSFWLVSGKTVSFVSSAGDADFGMLEHFRAAAVMIGAPRHSASGRPLRRADHVRSAQSLESIWCKPGGQRLSAR